MNTENTDEMNGLTHRIIGCALKVSNTLGAGFLEKVYENALVIELENCGLKVERQKVLQVFYAGHIVGDFCADIVVEDQVLLELKATKAIDPAHQAQVLNYLKATGLEIGLLINLGAPRLAVKRMRL